MTVASAVAVVLGLPSTTAIIGMGFGCHGQCGVVAVVVAGVRAVVAICSNPSTAIAITDVPVVTQVLLHKYIRPHLLPSTCGTSITSTFNTAI